MKKSVLLVMLVIFVASVVYVSFFGIRISYDNVRDYVTDVTCINEEMQIQSDGRKTITLSFDDPLHYGWGVDEHGNPELAFRFLLIVRVLPDYATIKDLDYIYDQNIPGFKISAKGIVTITDLSGGPTYEITIRSIDGSKKSDMIYLRVL